MEELKNNNENEEILLNLLDELDELMEGLVNGLDFCSLGGMGLLLEMVQQNSFSSVRSASALIITICAQNNVDIQEYLLDSEAILLINRFIKDDNQKAKLAVLGLLSSIVRGTNMRAKRMFLEVEGLELLKMVLENNWGIDIQKFQQKALNLLHDLLFYDQELDKTYYDLSPFMNTNSKKHTQYIQQKDKIIIDQKKVDEFNNYQIENSKFKGMVKKGVMENKVLSGQLMF